MNKRKSYGLLVVVLFALTASAQEKWSLQRCVTYAIANNISVKQSQVQEKISDVQYRQSLNSRWPSVNIGNNGGFQFGRSIDPVTNQFTNQEIGFISGNIQTGVTLFNWFSTKNTIAAGKLTADVGKMQTEKIKDDISLNVINAYLNALLGYEQMEIAAVTMKQTAEQLSNVQKRVNVGALPELSAAEMEAQFARDSTTYITAQSNWQLNLLQLKAILNMDAAAVFDIEKPPVELIPVDPLIELEPSVVYRLALSNQPQQQANRLKLAAADKSVLAARGKMYPVVSLFGDLQTSFSSANKVPNGTPILTVNPTASFVTIGGNDFFVQSPSARFNSFKTVDPLRQFSDNFRQSLGLNLQIPVFNGHQARGNWERSKLDRQNILLQMQADTLSLKQSIYQAYRSAVSALQSYHGRKKIAASAQYAYDLGKKRHDIGLLATLDLVTLSSNLQRANIDVVSAQFDYVFRMKVLEFYKGRGLKL